MKRPSVLAIALATASLAGGYGLAGRWPGLGLVMVAGIIWLLGPGWRLWRFEGLMLLAFGGLAGAGTWSGAPPLLMVAGLTAALSGWDLALFERRLAQAKRVADEPGLRGAHGQRLGLVGGLSLLLAGLALSLQLQFNLGGAILLGLLLVIGLGRVVGSTRSSS